MAEGSASRLVQVDALRGIAALLVVGFHFTTRFADLYKPASSTWLSLPWGHYGVNLFFMISGFVIFMTLQRTRVGMDFVVSRFSRLYPAYWAAVLLTWAVTHAIGLPGQEVGVGTAALNLLMFHNLFGVPHVDGAYWTLEVELLFYCAMFALFKAGRLSQVHVWMIALLALRWVYFGAEHTFGVSLPWTIYRLLILPYLPWFALGVAVHALSQGKAGSPRRGAYASVGVALATLFFTESVVAGALAVALLGVLWCAATGRLRLLASAPLAWLGSVSYPLYLIHEYIGWSLLLALLRQGWEINAAVAVVLAAVLLMAHVLSRTVEQPAMAWIRRAWRQRAPVAGGAQPR